MFLELLYYYSRIVRTLFGVIVRRLTLVGHVLVSLNASSVVRFVPRVRRG